MLIAEFIFMLMMLYIGSRYGGIGLGVVSGIGILVEVFILRMPPASAPVDVMLIIIAVVSCAAILEAAGGLKYMLQIAEKILRKNPKRITFLGPLVTYTLSIMLGTGHAVYSIMPIIGDIALKNKIRPERPMAAASVSSQLALTGSPIAAVVACYLGKDVLQLPGLEDLNLLHILAVTFPATLLGTVCMSIYSNFRGRELEDDPEYQRRLQDPAYRDQILNTTKTTLNEELPFGAKLSVAIFLLSLALIVLIAIFPEVRTIGEGTRPISMGVIIQMMMLGFGAIILIATKTPVKTIPNGVVFKSGMVACIAIFGIAWMSNTYFAYAMPEFKAAITGMVNDAPWTFALALFSVSVVVNSQAATAKIMLPVAIAIGLPGPVLIGLMPATYAYFFIPNYPSDIATVNFDVTGTTKIGKWYFNHSFMVPGLIGVVVACCVGLSLAEIII
ncbi:anaerobic C4-dicarboxylate transporter [Succinivibrio dextrinosolvens]|uniref:C4-dicarboxylate transporter n=1 Tax=Succinivibrio dextrinosolvens TaxID=83771 RepID=A0A662Z7V7_9GAMM|nr:anaerobic C4-dicarboxylate transporter [Succinivibrio dextrinosolvens]SFJ75368.1 anaerobic C4-dicarboxylate transporter DcuB [Succinivibrio dextrinosolvens]